MPVNKSLFRNIPCFKGHPFQIVHQSENVPETLAQQKENPLFLHPYLEVPRFLSLSEAFFFLWPSGLPPKFSSALQTAVASALIFPEGHQFKIYT